VLASLLDFVIGVAMLELVLLARGEAPALASLALVPLLMMLLQLVALGAGFVSAALSVKYRDVQYVVPFLIQLLLYASPVAYGITAVPRAVRPLYLLNPVAPLLDGLRAALLGRGDVHWMAIGGSALVSVALFTLGTLFFLYQDRQYADVI
jgi:lipopolysaccharide transport system permease protein